MEKINLGTKPINISLGKYDFLDYSNLNSIKKTRIKLFSIIALVIIVVIILLIITGNIHQNKDEVIENNNIIRDTNQNLTLNSIKSSSSFSSLIGNRTISSPSASSSGKEANSNNK